MNAEKKLKLKDLRAGDEFCTPRFDNTRFVLVGVPYEAPKFRVARIIGSRVTHMFRADTEVDDVWHRS